jgi:hypothetical protein
MIVHTVKHNVYRNFFKIEGSGAGVVIFWGKYSMFN